MNYSVVRNGKVIVSLQDENGEVVGNGRGFDEAINIKDFSLLKWIGANSFRTADYPYSEEIMRLADKEGIVIIDKTPGVGLHLNFMATLYLVVELEEIHGKKLE